MWDISAKRKQDERSMIVGFKAMFIFLSQSPLWRLFIHARWLSMHIITSATTTHSGHIPIYLGLACLLEMSSALGTPVLRLLAGPTLCRHSTDRQGLPASCLLAGSSPSETCKCDHTIITYSTGQIIQVTPLPLPAPLHADLTKPSQLFAIPKTHAWLGALQRHDGNNLETAILPLRNDMPVGLLFSSRRIGLVLYLSCLLTLQAKP
jgi:hypothetical protein